MNTKILSLVGFIYLAAFILYALGSITGRRKLDQTGTVVAYTALILHSAGLLIRWVESYRLGIGHAPLSNFYESLIFFSWAIILLYLTVFRKRVTGMGVFIMPVAFILMAYASFSPDIESKIQPLIPALKSNWLVSHVITCFLGYAAFVIASVFGIMYLVRTRKPDLAGRPESDNRLAEMMYQSIVIGFSLFTIGIMTGSVWAYSAWGSYWSWDPKETWALITWLIYAAALHARMLPNWQKRRIAVMTVIGLLSVLFTYFGVNYLPGLHSYL